MPKEAVTADPPEETPEEINNPEEPKQQPTAAEMADDVLSELGEETAGGDEPSAAETAGDGDEEEPQDGLSEETLDLARSLGLSDEEANALGSEEEIQRSLNILGLMASRRGRGVMEDQSPQPGKESGKEAGPPEDSPGDFDPGSLKDEFGDYDQEKVAAAMESLMKRSAAQEKQLETLQGELKQYEDEVVTREQESLVNQFHDLVDDLGHSEIFGKGENLTDKQLDAREALGKEVAALQFGLAEMGRDVPLTKRLVERVANSAFAAELKSKKRAETARKAKRQSSKRLGGGGSTVPSQNYDGDPRDDPELHALYDKLSEG